MRRPTRQPLLLLVPLLCLLLGASGDPGLVLELDRETFRLTARDLAGDVDGPTLRVVTGSPSHPTPAGEFPLYSVVRNPGWEPGDTARRLGARPIPPSERGPLGVAKITFAGDGVALHGGADPLLLGKPMSLGCVRTLDAELLGLLAWLEERDGLLRPRPQPDGELHQGFRRPARIVVR
ncbi:MAG: L,D-transpeptidase [Myxococcota bacterium]